MSLLANTLERILRWFRQHQPSVISLLQPGLAREEIEDKVKDLPFQLPEEVYELYQWRNGTNYEELGCIFDQYSFPSLEDTLSTYHNFYYSEELDIFPLFPHNFHPEYLIVAMRKGQRDYNILSVDGKEGGVNGEGYDSLTSMMLTIAEYYEAGFYYSYEESYYFSNDIAMELIWKKYNIGNSELISLY